MAATTSAPATPARVRSRVPSKRVLHLINPLVTAILRSRFHGVASNYALLLTYTGRRSGKTYTTPVGYIADGDTVTISSSTGWWKNVRGGAPVAMLLRGSNRTGQAEVIEDPAAVLEVVEGLIERYGPKRAGQWLSIALDVSRPPSREELARAMEGRVLVRIRLDGPSDQGGE